MYNVQTRSPSPFTILNAFDSVGAIITSQNIYAYIWFYSRFYSFSMYAFHNSLKNYEIKSKKWEIYRLL